MTVESVGSKLILHGRMWFSFFLTIKESAYARLQDDPSHCHIVFFHHTEAWKAISFLQ